MFSAFKSKSLKTALLIKPISKDISKQATDSFIEPNEISIKRLKSLSDFLAEPSAIFKATDNALLLNWEVKSNKNSLGNLLVSFRWL